VKMNPKFGPVQKELSETDSSPDSRQYLTIAGYSPILEELMSRSAKNYRSEVSYMVAFESDGIA